MPYLIHFLIAALCYTIHAAPRLLVNSTTYYNLDIMHKGELETIVTLVSCTFGDTTDNMSSSLIKDIHFVRFVIEERLDLENKNGFNYDELMNRIENTNGDPKIKLLGAYTINDTNYLQFGNENEDFNFIFFNYLQNIAYAASNIDLQFFLLHLNDKLLTDKNRKEDGSLVETSDDTEIFEEFFILLSSEKSLTFIKEKNAYSFEIIGAIFKYMNMRPEKYVSFPANSGVPEFENKSFVKFLDKFADDNEGFRKRYNYNATNRLVIIGAATMSTIERATFEDQTCYLKIFNEGTSCNLTTTPDDDMEVNKETWNVRMIKAKSITPAISRETQENTTQIRKQSSETTHLKSSSIGYGYYILGVVVIAILIIAIIYFLNNRNSKRKLRIN